MKEEIREAIERYSDDYKASVDEVLFDGNTVFWYLSGYVPGATISEVIEVMDEMRKEFLSK